MLHYLIYGLSVTCNRPLPGACAAGVPPTDPVHIEMGGPWPEALQSAPPTQWVRRPDHGDPENFEDAVLPVGDRSFWRIRYTVGETPIEFAGDDRGRHIWVRFPPGATFDDVTSLLLGSVLARVLRLRGVFCLHAGVVVIGDRAIAIAGGKGAGKSSTAAALAAAGHAVLSDDIAALTEDGARFIVQPGYQRLRLWKPAINALYGSRDGLPRVQSDRNKRYLDLSADPTTAWRFQPDPLPLAAIYLLNARGRATTPTVHAVPPSAALPLLVAHSFGRTILSQEMRAREFAFLGRLVSHVPVRELERPDDIGALGALCAAIENDVGLLVAARPPRGRHST